MRVVISSSTLRYCSVVNFIQLMLCWCQHCLKVPLLVTALLLRPSFDILRPPPHCCKYVSNLMKLCLFLIFLPLDPWLKFFSSLFHSADVWIPHIHSSTVQLQNLTFSKGLTNWHLANFFLLLSPDRFTLIGSAQTRPNRLTVLFETRLFLRVAKSVHQCSF